jgi:chromosome segregation ATPase
MAKKSKVPAKKAKAFKATKASKTGKVTDANLLYAGPTGKRQSASQKLAAEAQKRSAKLLQRAAKAQAKANKAAVQAKNKQIAAAAIKQDIQNLAREQGQHSQLIRSMQARYSFYEEQAKVYLNRYSNQRASGGYLQKAQRAASKTETLAQAKAYIKQYQASHKLSKKALAAYKAKQSKLETEHVEHMEHLAHLKKSGKHLTGAQTAQLKAFNKQLSAANAYRAAKAKKSAATRSADKKKAAAAKKRGAEGASFRGFSPWLHGYNDEYDSCVQTAVCNRLRILGVNLDNEHVMELLRDTGENCRIGECLEHIRNRCPELEYYMITPEEGRAVNYEAMIIGFESVNGPHAGMVENGRAVYWGRDHRLPEDIEEAWFLGWEPHIG